MSNLKNKKVVKLAKLDHAVLAILHNCELSGYDITNRLKHFWKTSHSRIYPTLAKLEGMGLLKFTEVRQSDRPDKKVYRLTNNGTKELKVWVHDHNESHKAVQDEILLKILCSDLITQDELVEIAKQRMNEAKQSEEKVKKMLENINLEKSDFVSNIIGEILSLRSVVDSHIFDWILANNGKDENEKIKLKDYLKNHWI